MDHYFLISVLYHIWLLSQLNYLHNYLIVNITIRLEYRFISLIIYFIQCNIYYYNIHILNICYVAIVYLEFYCILLISLQQFLHNNFEYLDHDTNIKEYHYYCMLITLQLYIFNCFIHLVCDFRWMEQLQNKLVQTLNYFSMYLDIMELAYDFLSSNLLMFFNLYF